MQTAAWPTKRLVLTPSLLSLLGRRKIMIIPMVSFLQIRRPMPMLVMGLLMGQIVIMVAGALQTTAPTLTLQLLAVWVVWRRKIVVTCCAWRILASRITMWDGMMAAIGEIIPAIILLAPIMFICAAPQRGLI